jgi:predicted metalloprotease with PDZ domain
MRYLVSSTLAALGMAGMGSLTQAQVVAEPPSITVIPEANVLRLDRVNDPKAATLGMHILPTGSKRDTLGLFITWVAPDGPAESAGIYEGDRIAAINGIDLRVATTDLDDEFASTISAHRLTRAMKKASPGTKVDVRVYSGGKFRNVQVTAGAFQDVFKNEFKRGRAFMSDEWTEMGVPSGAIRKEALSSPQWSLRS